MLKFSFGKKAESRKCTAYIAKLIDCRSRMEQREQFLTHKLKDIMIETRSLKATSVAKKILANRAVKLQGMIDNTFQSRLTVDGYIDSLVTMGVLKESEQSIAASRALSAAEELMGSIASTVADVNEMCSVLAEDICDSNEEELLALLHETSTEHDEAIEEPPLPPSNILIPNSQSHNVRGDEIAIG